ncbi:MAG: hypothetical protein QCI00_10275, partial [Candidatus Thermoplasmatota archaeon]|nr:hypothetical protein [Candidatus Thermoplasmatota archaeon]
TMKPITENQLEYIKILSSYEPTKETDQKVIDDYLGEINKTLNVLNVKEGSELIQRLLKVQVLYSMPCGEKVLLDKQEVNRGNVLGKLELCLHSCPKGGDVNNCEYWLNK